MKNNVLSASAEDGGTRRRACNGKQVQADALWLTALLLMSSITAGLQLGVYVCTTMDLITVNYQHD